MRGRFAGRHEIARAELIGNGDHGCSHGTVFMGALRPHHAFFGINPNGESQFAYGLLVNRTGFSTGMPSRKTMTITVSPGLCWRRA